MSSGRNRLTPCDLHVFCFHAHVEHVTSAWGSLSMYTMYIRQEDCREHACLLCVCVVWSCYCDTLYACDCESGSWFINSRNTSLFLKGPLGEVSRSCHLALKLRGLRWLNGSSDGLPLLPRATWSTRWPPMESVSTATLIITTHYSAEIRDIPKAGKSLLVSSSSCHANHFL